MDGVDDLFSAVFRGDTAGAKALVATDEGLPRAKNSYGLSILQFARYMGRDRLLEALIAAGRPLDVFDAASLDRVGRLRELLDSDPALVRAYGEDGFTALHVAAYYGSPGALAPLLDRGADIEAVTTNFLTNMPIHAGAAGRARLRRLQDAARARRRREREAARRLHAHLHARPERRPSWGRAVPRPRRRPGREERGGQDARPVRDPAGTYGTGDDAERALW